MTQIKETDIRNALAKTEVNKQEDIQQGFKPPLWMDMP